MAAAEEKEGLSDWGPLPFEEPLAALWTATQRRELNDIGAYILRSGILHSLRMRLRAQEWIRRNPEIADERIGAPVVVVGMMRSGTTLLQRLLAADPRFHCAYGWEVVEVAPKLDHRWAARTRGSRSGEARERESRELAPGPVRDPPDVRARGRGGDRLPLRRVPLPRARGRRARAGVPGVDRRPGLHARLRVPAPDAAAPAVAEAAARRRPRDRWVLKSPAHLGYLDGLREQFPDLHVVHLHRDPRETIASGASLNATLHAMHADTVDLHRVGAEWIQRMGWTNDRAMATRDSWADEAQRVTDIEFGDAVADPIGQVARVYDAIGVELTADAEAAMRHWLVDRPREPGAPRLRARDLRAECQPDRRALRRLQREIPVRTQTQRSSECLTTRSPPPSSTPTSWPRSS